VAELIKRDRRIAKRCNFLLLFGGGGAHLARQLGIPESEGRRLRQEYFAMMPAIRGLMYGLSDLAAERGFIINPFGRVLRFPRVDMSYKALNTLIQSTGADIMKVCLVRVDDYLAGKKSKIILTVHDELLIEMHDDEHYIIPEVKAIMEGVFINPHLTLTCSHFVTKENWGCL
jgi:DNA polymerase-1